MTPPLDDVKPLNIPNTQWLAAQWLYDLIKDSANNVTYCDEGLIKAIVSLLDDKIIWNSLQNFLALLLRASDDGLITVEPNSLLFLLMQQGFRPLLAASSVCEPPMRANYLSMHKLTYQLSDKHATNSLQIIAPFQNEILIDDIHYLDNLKQSSSSKNETNALTPQETSPFDKSLGTINQPILGDKSIQIDTSLLPASHIDLAKQVSSDTKIHNMPNFQLPNAKVQQPYQATIRPTQSDCPIVINNVQIPNSLGLMFEAEQAIIKGTPLVAGEFNLGFDYQDHLGDTKSDTCLLIVNPDPKSLWQINEPDNTLPYPKPHEDRKYIKQTNYILVGCSRRGRSHEHAGSFRDDDFYISVVDGLPDWSIMIAADGAGSAKYSREGSRIVVNTIGNILKTSLGTVISDIEQALFDVKPGQNDEISQLAYSRINAMVNPLFQDSITLALDAIEAEAKSSNSDIKDFATTLLMGIVRQQNNQTFITSFWIGDGAIAVYSSDKIRLMGKPDGGQYAGQTSFLNRTFSHNMNERMRMGYYDSVEAVLLLTDGVSDPKFETDAGLEQQALWNQLWAELSPLLNEENPDQALLDWMHFLTPGHHDDRTMVILQPNQTTTLLSICSEEPCVNEPPSQGELLNTDNVGDTPEAMANHQAQSPANTTLAMQGDTTWRM